MYFNLLIYSHLLIPFVFTILIYINIWFLPLFLFLYTIFTYIFFKHLSKIKPTKIFSNVGLMYNQNSYNIGSSFLTMYGCYLCILINYKRDFNSIEFVLLFFTMILVIYSNLYYYYNVIFTFFNYNCYLVECDNKKVNNLLFTKRKNFDKNDVIYAIKINNNTFIEL